MYVHKHLLCERSIWLEDEVEYDDTSCSSVYHASLSVPLGHGARVLWSRWLYGQPMWMQKDCSDPDKDLEALAEIYTLCSDSDDKGEDLAGMNAALDGIRDVLVNDAHVPVNPLSTLLEPLKDGTIGRTMLLELLVCGRCATEGRTKAWLNRASHELEEDEDFVLAVSLEFAEKATLNNPLNPMARCAYHIHMTMETRCDEAV